MSRINRRPGATVTPEHVAQTLRAAAHDLEWFKYSVERARQYHREAFKHIKSGLPADNYLNAAECCRQLRDHWLAMARDAK